MILPDLANKRKIILVEHVSNDFAQKYSEFYPSIVFFTDDQTIWKNGICYTQPIKVDPNQNKIDVNDITYELQIENNVLKVLTKNYLYWGIFGTINEELILTPDITRYNIKGQYENGFGWRKITSNKNIIDYALDDILSADENHIYNIFYKEKDNNVKIPEYSNLFLGPIYDIRENNKRPIKFEKPVDTIHLFIPEVLIEKYKVGIYDDLDGSNLLTQFGKPYNNKYATNFANKFNHILDESKYERYIHYEIKNPSLSDIFTFRIYSKENIINKNN